MSFLAGGAVARGAPTLFTLGFEQARHAVSGRAVVEKREQLDDAGERAGQRLGNPRRVDGA